MYGSSYLHLFSLQPCVDKIKLHVLELGEISCCTADGHSAILSQSRAYRFFISLFLFFLLLCGLNSASGHPHKLLPCIFPLNYAFYVVSCVKMFHVCDMWRRAQSWILAVLQNLTGKTRLLIPSLEHFTVKSSDTEGSLVGCQPYNRLEGNMCHF